MTSLPQQFQYKNTTPGAFANKVRTIRFNAQNIYQNIQVNDIIRFLINTNGFWDPYNCYLDIQIATDSVTPQQIDCTGHSLIRNMVISCKGSEIERINEYNMLANMLTDLKYSNSTRNEISYTGMSGFPGTDLKSFVNPAQTGINWTATPSTSYPTTATHNVVSNQPGFNVIQGHDPNSLICFDSNSYHITNSNAYKDDGSNASLGTPGAQYLRKYYPMGIAPDNSIYVQNMVAKCNGYPWQWYFNQRRNPNTGNIEQNPYFRRQGPLVDFDPQLAATSFEPVLFSDAVAALQSNSPQTYVAAPSEFVNGQPYDYIKQGGGTILNLKLPFMSSYFGHLLPQSEYKFIPMKCFRDLEFEFQLDPYATFACLAQSGTNAGLTTAMAPNATRSYKILAFSIVVDMVLIDDQLETTILNTALQSGMIWNTNSWATGPQFICNNGNVPPTCQINLGFNSLRSLLFCFNSNDYTSYPFCRKFYRNSMCLTSLQLKIGTEYLPPQPITGNSGNSQPLSGASNVKVTNRNSNADFILNTYKALGKLWDTSRDNMINPRNFAVNDRYWDPSNVNAPISNALSTPTTVLTDNVDTALAWPMFHENRCVGKSIFGMDVEGLWSEDKSYTSGLNTIDNRPFDIIFGQDTGGLVGLNRSSTLYMFFLYDAALKISGTLDSVQYSLLGKS